MAERLRKANFSELNDWTITDIASTEKARPMDRKKAEIEIVKRKKAGTYNPEDAPRDTRGDLLSHGYGVENGKVLYPKPEYKSWLESDRSEPIPRGAVREIGKKSLNLYPIDESNARSLDEINFSDIYSQKELEEQEGYVKWVESQTATLEETRRSQLDQSLESIFVYGVQRAWLGNNSDFDTDAIRTSKYDDYKHRVDAAVTMKLKDPRDIENIGDKELVFGVDVTTSGKEATIRDKFDRPHNDETLEVPEGFTGIGRYSDRHKHRRLSLVPRYVVGLNAAEVETILDTVPRNKSGELMFKRNIQSELLRFQVLAEICAQNTLYKDALEDKVDQGDETVDRAYNMLNIIDRTMNKALDETTMNITTQASMFAKKKFKDMDERHEAVDKLVRDRGEQDVEEYKGKLISRGESVDPNYRDTYTQIMYVIDEKAKNLTWHGY